MSVNHKDACPCGSGKRYKHCHLGVDQARRSKTSLAGILVIGAIVIGAAAFGAMNQWQLGKKNADLAGADSGLVPPGGRTGGATTGGDVSGTPAPTGGNAFGIVQPGATGRPPIPQSNAGAVIPIGNSGALAPGEHPTPWEYDVAKNRHYDPRPGHQHWHNGPPPADTTQAVVVAPRQIKLDEKGNVISETASRVAGSTMTVGSAQLAPGEKPQAWQYDKAKNQYYDPTVGHQHWHSGPAPAGKVVGVP